MQVIITTATRGAEDISDRLANWMFSTRAGIGFATARVSVSAPNRDLWHLLNASSSDSVEFYHAGVLVWSGYIAGATLRETALVVEAEGVGLRLNDVEVWRAFADPGVRNWDTGPESDGFGMDNNNRVYVEAGNDVTYSDGDEGTMVYPNAADLILGGEIVRVEARAVVTVTDGAWVAELRDDASNILWSSAVAADEDIAATVADADGLVFALRKDGDGAGEATARLTQVVVRTMYPCTSSDIIEHFLSSAGLETDGIVASELVVDRAVWQGQGRGTAIRDMAELGDGTETWRFGIFERAIFGSWPDDASWLLVAGEGDVEVGYRRAAVRNAVRARLPDGHVTDWYTDTASLARWGRREKTLDLPQTTWNEADQLAQVWLTDHAWPPITGLRIKAEAVIRALGGPLWPVWRIRAGQVITLRDVFPYRDVDVRIAETQATRGGVAITPLGAESRVELWLAVMARQLGERTAGEARSTKSGVLRAMVGISAPGGAHPGTIWVDTS